MNFREFFAYYYRVTNALSLIFTLLLLLPSFPALAQPSLQTASQVKPHVALKSATTPVAQLKVGDVIPARSNATGKVEWKQVTHASKRTVSALLNVQLTDARTGDSVTNLTKSAEVSPIYGVRWMKDFRMKDFRIAQRLS